MSDHHRLTKWVRIAGWAVLALALPVALLAALHAPNEYRATLGINALDCNGPFETYLFAAPALLVYGIGLIVNGLRWRRPRNAFAAILCFVICTAVAINVARAVAEDHRQAEACE